MDILQKLSLLNANAPFEVDWSAETQCGDFTPTQPPTAPPKTHSLGHSITTLVRSDGKRISVLKTMLSSFCARNCFYCPWRRGRDLPRVQFTPDELATAFMQLHAKRLVEGLFLSSGIHGRSSTTMDRLIATTELLRRKHVYRGYIHLKVMPGVDRASVAAAMNFADRISINLEAPNALRLQQLAPEKNLFSELLPALYWANDINDERRARGQKPVSATTQFVVGAVGESDRELVSTVTQLYDTAHLSRAYYSAFHPVPNTPLDGLPPADPRREHRLYQVDFLLRQYGFKSDELVFDAAGNLPRDVDPKLLYAQAHPEKFPLELTRASREELLRVPGLGPRSVARIVQLRRQGALRDFDDLAKLGIAARRAAPFILLRGRRPLQQLPLMSNW
jgi:predicted DNA-binding helix-hairpin-helix protein